MIERNRRLSVILAFLLPLMLFPLASAQFGEVAGQLFANVSVGSSNTVTFTLVNSGSTPISFEVVVPPSYTTSSSNTVFPQVTTNSKYGTVQPGSEFTVTLNVYVPSAKENKPGTEWVGIVQAIMVKNNSNITGSGANIQAGVAKILTVRAIEPTTPWTLYGAIIIIAASIGAVGTFVYNKKRSVRTERRTSTASAASRKKSAVRGTRRKATRPSKRKKTAGKRGTSKKGKRSTARKTAKRRRTARR